VLQRVGVVAYKLDLLPTSSLHLVFHVSQLKKVVPAAKISASLPLELSEFQAPEKLLQRQAVSRGVFSVV
jgi:hypothetical protein